VPDNQCGLCSEFYKPNFLINLKAVNFLTGTEMRIKKNPFKAQKAERVKF
jgi:hypothetical protein